MHEINKGKISVIMGIYNCEKTLPKAIDSILSQTYTNYELILCDDCSTDNTYTIAKEYQEKNPDNIILVQNDLNSHLAYTLNHCLKYATGEYVARMDGDDISEANRFEKQVAFLDSHPEYAVVGTAMIPFDESGDRPIRYAKEEPTADDMLSRSPFFHATIMMRKSAYDAVGGYCVSKRTERAQDYDMWFRFFVKGFKGYNLQEGLYHVLEDDNAIRRRTFKTRAYEVQTRLKGYRMLNYPLHRYIYAFKPIIAALVPVNMMQKYHAATDGKQK